MRHPFFALAFTFVASSAIAQDFPSKPLRIIVPFPAGGATDLLARTVGQKLSDQWKQPVVVDNRPGAGANLGAEVAAKSAPDGYTLFMASTAHSINQSLFQKLQYDLLRDFTPIALVAETTQVLAVHPSIAASNVKELIELAKAKPGQLNYSSAGNGSLPHLAAELFKSTTGTNFVHVPYKGAPQAMTDLLAGVVAVSFATAPTAIPHIRSGKLKPLAVSSAKRLAALPTVPTIAESGLPGFEASQIFGLIAPTGVPLAIVTQINTAVTAIVRDPATVKFLGDQGAEPRTGSAAEYNTFLRDEVAKWAKVVKDSGAKVD